jgi:TIR domain
MQPIKIFFSFAPDSLKDRKYVSHLEKHLADQKRLGEVKIWHVHKASPGANVEQEILTNLKNADIILIFMSPDYMANDNCVDLEGSLVACYP